MKVYKALQRSLLTYVAPVRQPWAALSRVEHLEHFQYYVLRMVTGQLNSTPVETIRRETGTGSIASASMRATALAHEKAHRLPQTHPKTQILSVPSHHRFKRSSCRYTEQAAISH